MATIFYKSSGPAKRWRLLLQYSYSNLCDFLWNFRENTTKRLLKPEILPNWYPFFLNKSYQLGHEYCSIFLYILNVPALVYCWNLVIVSFQCAVISFDNFGCIKWQKIEKYYFHYSRKKNDLFFWWKKKWKWVDPGRLFKVGESYM